MSNRRRKRFRFYAWRRRVRNRVMAREQWIRCSYYDVLQYSVEFMSKGSDKMPAAEPRIISQQEKEGT